MARPPKYVEGVYEKYPGSGVWYTRLRVDSVLVRRRVGTHAQAVAPIEKARTIRRSGEGSLPTTAKLPVRTKDEVEKYGSGILIGALIDRYEEHIKNPANPDRPTDVEKVLSMTKSIRADLGDRDAARFSPKDIRAWLVAKKRKPGTLNKYKSALSAIYTLGVQDDLVEANPCRLVEHYKVVLGLPRWLTEEEEDKIRAVLDRWIKETPEHHTLTRLWLQEHHNELTVAIGTGFRKANQYKLKFSDNIDFEGRYIRLQRTKNDHPHVIAMIDDVHDALKDQKRIHAEIANIERRVEITADTTRVAHDDRVFSITENREWWKKAVK